MFYIATLAIIIKRKNTKEEKILLIIYLMTQLLNSTNHISSLIFSKRLITHWNTKTKILQITSKINTNNFLIYYFMTIVLVLQHLLDNYREMSYVCVLMKYNERYTNILLNKIETKIQLMTKYCLKQIN